jgi:hypothetical protein
MKLIATEGRGLILHLHQEGRGHGLSLKIAAVGKMQRAGLDTVEAFEALGLEQDVRCYDNAVRVLQLFGIDAVRLITNNPRKVRYLEQHGIRAEMVNTHPTIRSENADYLKTKQAKLGHHLPLEWNDALSEEPVRFYHSDQPWGELSNFSRHASFSTAESGRPSSTSTRRRSLPEHPRRRLIRCAATPLLAKRLAAELSELGTVATTGPR